jgi:hypothetical protein
MTPEDRAAAWDNAVNHYSGNHENCPWEHTRDQRERRWDKIGDHRVVDELRTFLKVTRFIPLRCVSEYSTQTNESLNRSRIKFAIKDVRWGYSYNARMACAVLDRNCPYWKIDLRERLEIGHLHPDPLLKLLAFEHARLTRKIRASTATDKAQKAALRRLDKGRAQRVARGLREGKYTYECNPYSAEQLPPLDVGNSEDVKDMEAFLGPEQTAWPEEMNDFLNLVEETQSVEKH